MTNREIRVWSLEGLCTVLRNALVLLLALVAMWEAPSAPTVRALACCAFVVLWVDFGVLTLRDPKRALFLMMAAAVFSAFCWMGHFDMGVRINAFGIDTNVGGARVFVADIALAAMGALLIGVSEGKVKPKVPWKEWRFVFPNLLLAALSYAAIWCMPLQWWLLCILGGAQTLACLAGLTTKADVRKAFDSLRGLCSMAAGFWCVERLGGRSATLSWIVSAERLPWAERLPMVLGFTAAYVVLTVGIWVSRRIVATARARAQGGSNG